MIIMNYNYNYYKKIKRTQIYTVTSEVMHCWFKQCISLFACDFSQDLSLSLAHAGCGWFNFFFNRRLVLGLGSWLWQLGWASLVGCLAVYCCLLARNLADWLGQVGIVFYCSMDMEWLCINLLVLSFVCFFCSLV
jgi:hypothetical protein